MIFAGLPKDTDRDNLVAYLAQFGSDGKKSSYRKFGPRTWLLKSRYRWRDAAGSREVFLCGCACARPFTAAITYVDNGNFVVPMHDSEFIDAEGKLVE
jgi:hypothetical protein